MAPPDMHDILQRKHTLEQRLGPALNDLLYHENAGQLPMVNDMRAAFARILDLAGNSTLQARMGDFFNKPPFAVDPDIAAADPAGYARHAGKHMEAFYRSLVTGDAIEGTEAEKPGRITAPEVMAAGMLKLGVDADSPEYRAGMVIALAAEKQLGNSYHDRLHMIEVMCNKLFILQMNQALAETGATGAIWLEPRELAKSMIAAAAHDLLHDGVGNFVMDADGRKVMIDDGTGKMVPKTQRFKCEDASFAAARPWLELAGLEQEDITDIRDILRTTDPTGPHNEMKAAWNHSRIDAPVPDGTLGPGLERMQDNPRLVLQAAMMHDADLMGSAALGLDWNIVQTARLRPELPFLPPEDFYAARGFVNFVVGGKLQSPGASVMNPNVTALKEWAETASETWDAMIERVRDEHARVAAGGDPVQGYKYDPRRFGHG